MLIGLHGNLLFVDDKMKDLLNFSLSNLESENLFKDFLNKLRPYVKEHAQTQSQNQKQTFCII